LLGLAGPETSGTDRDAMDEDACDDVPTMGDWCLGLLAPASESVVAQAIDQRNGCAAISRAVRRGRRRIEGLPATPDMGQRILVTVLTGSSRPPAVTPSPRPPDAPAAVASLGDDVATPADTAADAPPEVVDRFAPPIGDPTPDDVFDLLDDDAAEDDRFADATEAQYTTEEARGDEDAAVDPADALVVDTADMPQPVSEDSSPSGSWMPGPGDSTAELRLSDILSDEGEEDDPFAELDDAEPVADDTPADALQRSPRDPYSALRGLEDEGPLTPQGPVSPAFASPGTSPPPTTEDEALVGDYVEGQEEGYRDAQATSRMAGVLAWVLPILGGSAVGILVAIQIFGLP
ncbi:MAG TPA: hypothetical protein VMM13_01450, partial [Euzebya sp.]|nr:hypothetical protein [Euzebya sp.]